jgi:hypothetical protein
MADVKVNEQAVEQLDIASNDLTIRAAALVVDDKASLEVASSMLAGIKALLKEVDDVFKPPAQAAHAAHKSILDARRKVETPIKVAETDVKAAVATYHNELRKAAEAARKLEAERLRKQEEERRLAAAVAAEDRGQNERAEKLIAEPAPVLSKPLITTPPPPKVAGITTQDQYTGKVVDLPAFIQWSLDTLSFSEYFDLKQSVLDRAIQRKKGDVTIPGVEVHKQTMVKSRKV